MLVSTLVETYLAWVKTHRAENTWMMTRSTMNNLARRLGEAQAESLKIHPIEDWLDLTGWSKPNTQLIALYRLSAMLSWAVKRELISHNPIKGKLELPHGTSRGRECVISNDTFNLLCGSACPHFSMFLIGMWETGCRPSEVAGLRVQDYDNEHGLWILGKHKTAYKTGERVVPLSPMAVKCSDWLLERKHSDYLFTDPKHHQWDRSRWIFFMRRLVRKLELPTTITCYSCRHSFAVRLLERGVSMYDVASLLGHKSIRMVERHYGHVGTNIARLKEILAV